MTQRELTVAYSLEPLSTFRVPISLRMPAASVNDNEAQCSADWTNGTTIQFVAFSVNHFSEVNFLMPAEFSVNDESTYACLFSHGARQMSTAVTKLGGSSMLDRFNYTLHLRCKIPEELQTSDHNSITFILGESLIHIRDFTDCDLLILQIWETVNNISFVFVEVIRHSEI